MTARTVLGLAAAGLWVMAACSLAVPASQGRSGSQASSPRTNGAPGGNLSSAPAGPTQASANFDPVHAARIAGPAVAMVIVGSGRGVAEGSGVAFQTDAESTDILTNNHVVTGASAIQALMPDGRHFEAKAVGTDAYEDLAVIRVPAVLPTARFGDSTKLQVGQPVLAIGSPLGNQSSVTAGVVSALHRTLIGVGGGRAGQQENLPDVLQTDAPINPGNSGGPLVDGNGLVVGINTAGSSSASGIGFAIPSSVAKRVAGNLAAGKPPADPYLGVCALSLENALAQGISVDGYGVLVQGVVSGGPASQAGLRANDLIRAVDGVTLNNGQTLGGALQLHSAGDQVRLAVSRGGSSSNIDVPLGSQPAQTPTC